MPTKRKPKKRKAAKISRRKPSKRRNRTVLAPKPSTVISVELPQTWGADCFNEKLINTRGFQAADLKPRYFAAYNKLIKEYGAALVIEPTGQPGITLSLKQDTPTNPNP